MKKLLLAAFVFIGSYTAVNAQAFGLKAGLNFANFSGNDADDFNVLTSFHAGLVAEMHLMDALSVQPEFLYSVQGAKTKEENYKLNYLNLPVMLKLYFTDSFNIHAGPQVGLLISESDNFDTFESNTYDLGFAGGVEFFFADNFSAQARYNVGTSKVSDNAELKNSVLQLSLCYMF
ncbi:porin family protein [Flavobacterium salilacus subsp. salilacus]|uniref:porin family protein n=1 Tax=Flavobacterium TaxID=237 RepID=UPI0010750170|nr:MULTISPECIES: porin family protein [Flavobacterium]KAF2518519.1 porin family protein [Flavobacterium salilacus subsp. salilacus]MBE1615161.1 porin family protein [Flavobacterium sp. SaA2.13]NDI98150.1 porin family protein [Flavobacterium salilacus subsp. altitudinum]